jgi:hypothetical protein
MIDTPKIAGLRAAIWTMSGLAGLLLAAKEADL